MNIAIVCYPTVGGSGIVATQLAYGISEYADKVHLISYSIPTRFDKFSEKVLFHSVDFPHYPLFEFHLYTLALAGKIVQIAAQESLDIVHCHYAIPHTISGILARESFNFGKRLKIVSTLHGTDVTLVGKQPLFRPLVEYSLNNSDAVTCVSEYLYRATVREFNVVKPIEVIHNFVDTSRFKRQENLELKQAFARNGERILIHISNFRPVKRVTDVVLFFEQVLKELPAKLILIGDGPDYGKVQEMVNGKNLNNDVYFLGNQFSVVEFLSIADLFVLTSEIESFGLAVCEAMSCEVPVVCYDVGGINEIVRNGITGYLVPFGEVDGLARKAIDILSSPEMQKSFSKNARKWVEENFDINIIIPKYVNLYSTLIGG